MRFLFVSTMNDWPWGGSEELWSRAALRLRREGHQVRASVADWPEKRRRLAPLVEQGIAIEYHLSQRPLLRQRALHRLARARRGPQARLRRHRPDLLIISQGHHAGSFAWARAAREASIPYVLIVHCNSEHWWFQDPEAAAAAYRGARRVFCVSAANLHLLRLQLGDPLPHAEIVRNPWNLLPGAHPDWPPEDGVARLALVGRLDPAAKGQDLALQVLALPEWRSRRVELHFYGAGPFESTLRRMAAMLDLANIRFHGHVSDVAGIWSQNHLLVLPSRFEGLPLALVEAMWCGRPAVVTDVGGNAELCLDGATGFVASAPTVPALASALEHAWQRRGDWPDIGRAARRRAEGVLPSDPVALFCERLKQLSLSGSAVPLLPRGGSKEVRQ